MKKISLFTIVALTAVLVSWKSYEMSKLSPKTYTLNKEQSKLNWVGRYVSDGHTHDGTVKITKGELQVTENNSVSGNFTIDMLSIVCNDLPDAKKTYLVKHLNSEDFFNTSKYNEVNVKVSGMTEKEIIATITVIGKEINAKIPVTITKTDKSIEAKGKFEIDFSSLEMPGTKAAKGKPENERTDSKISFDLFLVMNS